MRGALSAGPSRSRAGRRRSVILGGSLVASLSFASPVKAPGDLYLSTLPQHVYRIADEGKLKTESWYFELVVHDPKLRTWEAEGLELETLSAGKVVKATSWKGPAAAALHQRYYFPTPDLPPNSMRRHFSVADEVFTFPLIFSEKQSDAVEQVRVTLKLKNGKTTAQRTLLVPVDKFAQRTKLIFPFKGPAIVTQGRFNNGGHLHRETIFAIDVMALTPNYAPMLSDEDKNEAIAGWGKEILAPADGTVAYARSDVPTNPLYQTDAEALAALPEPLWAIAGNCVIIDHGNGEFSGLMHMQPGSVTLKKGDAVKQGQVIGKMGNSGDANMPHLHYQLTTGGLIFASDGLPFQFENLPSQNFTRGTYFNAR
ncbi:MAG TPA: M23 family metallopeptidase [Candidatus Polarisedimenticolia bacterium]|nr:M23 family metallopeptidase [Candidatus Polarisedimenticolia bacterium]